MTSPEDKVPNHNQLFHDASRLMSSAADTLVGAGREARGHMRERLRQRLQDLDFVPRPEFEALKQAFGQLQEELAALKADLASHGESGPGAPAHGEHPHARKVPTRRRSKP